MPANPTKDLVVTVQNIQKLTLGDLRSKQTRKQLDKLNAAIDGVEDLIARIESMLSQDSAPRRRRKGSRRRAGGGRFPLTDFILNQVKRKRRRGVRPVEIVHALEKAAPGNYSKPAASVGTILNRLKKRGEVHNKDGRWYAG